jgi:hypothetical protein
MRDTPNRSRGIALALLASFALTTVSSSVFAAGSTADKAVADQLFTEAKALANSGNFEAACPKFEASFQADPALGALLNLADCLERIGLPASAYGRWSDAVDLAVRAGDDRADFARERREALKQRIAYVTVEVSGTAPDLSVRRDTTPLAQGAYGVALPSDPGESTVNVVRGNDVVWEQRLRLAEGEKITVRVDLAAIAAANPPPLRSLGGVATSRPKAADTGLPDAFWSKQRVAGAIVGGVGVVGGVLGLLAGGAAMARADAIEKDGQCADGPRGPVCSAAGLENVRAGTEAANASTWILVGSGVVTAVGLTVFLTAPAAPKALEDRASIEPWIRVGPTGGAFGVRFE